MTTGQHLIRTVDERLHLKCNPSLPMKRTSSVRFKRTMSGPFAAEVDVYGHSCRYSHLTPGDTILLSSPPVLPRVLYHIVSSNGPCQRMRGFAPALLHCVPS